MNAIKKKPLIILTGPTAVGKSALSIALAKAVGGEIISADSMQVYKGMDVGTAKISKEEMDGIPHYLIDVLDPKEAFHVVRFKELGNAALEEIYHKNKIPILVGGTGFYIQALLYDIDFNMEEEKEDNAYRQELNELAKEKGAHYLHEMLKQVDPDSANAIHENNVKRVIRALEYYHDTGDQISKHNAIQEAKESPYQFIYFVLNDNRDAIYGRIEKRIDKMLEDGLVEEVKGLLDSGCKKEMVSMQGLGYKEIIDYLEGNLSLSEAVYILKRDTRHFAKRQLTWFRREKEVCWIQKERYETEADILKDMLRMIKEKGIL